MRDAILRAVLLMLLTGSIAEAQSGSRAAELERRLSPGQRVKVLTIDGARLEGRVDTLSTSAVRLTNGRTRRELAVEQLQQVKRQRPEGDGVWIGAGVGALVGLTYVQLHCRNASEHQGLRGRRDPAVCASRRRVRRARGRPAPPLRDHLRTADSRARSARVHPVAESPPLESPGGHRLLNRQ